MFLFTSVASTRKPLMSAKVFAGHLEKLATEYLKNKNLPIVANSSPLKSASSASSKPQHWWLLPFIATPPRIITQRKQKVIVGTCRRLWWRAMSFFFVVNIESLVTVRRIVNNYNKEVFLKVMADRVFNNQLVFSPKLPLPFGLQWF